MPPPGPMAQVFGMYIKNDEPTENEEKINSIPACRKNARKTGKAKIKKFSIRHMMQYDDQRGNAPGNL